MASSSHKKARLGPVFLGLFVLIFLSLGIGVFLPDALRGYDVEDLAKPRFETRMEKDLPDLVAKEKGLDRRADYLTWKAFPYAHCAVLDFGDIRLAVPRHRLAKARTWEGRIKIRSTAAPSEVDEKDYYRVGGKNLWLETRWKGHSLEARFCGVPFLIRGGQVQIAKRVFPLGKEERVLVVNREGKMEAGLRVLPGGKIEPLPTKTP